VSAQPANVSGELDTEVALPFRLEYQLDSEGELDVVTLVPLWPDAPVGLEVKFAALPPHEQRCLRAAAEADAERRWNEALLDRGLSESE
jgi:hypothetical protein